MNLIGIFMGIIRPKYNKYDIVIVGGAIMGSSAAYFLSQNSDFQGKILVIEKDLSFEYSSTARTNSCIRQQFSEPINVQISQFAAAFITSLNENRSEPHFQTKINIDNNADNIIPGSAEATFNIRFNNMHSSNSIKKRLNRIFKKI